MSERKELLAFNCTDHPDNEKDPAVVIEFGEMLNARDLLITSDVTASDDQFAWMRECPYIRVTNGTEQTEDEAGRTIYKTTLKTGTFELLDRAFLEHFRDFYGLRYRRQWFENNKPSTADFVKQKILAALLPFGISERIRKDIYNTLKVFCAQTDTTVEPLAIVSADDLNSKEYTRPPFIVDGFLCAGLTLLAAPPKTGKSFLALDLACCIAEGVPFWGFDTVQGNVLYCDLEGTEWRTQERLPAIGRKSKNDCPRSLAFVHKDVRPVDAGLIEQLANWVESVEKPRLIIIDTLAHVKGKVARGEDAYTADTRFMKPLHDLAIEKNISILAITHTRKANGFALDDPFDAVIGSTAQYGNSDAGWIIGGKRDESKKQFTAVGRDFDAVSFEIERTKGGRWVFNGTVEAVQERTQQDEYRHDEAVAFIKKYLPTCGGVWRCTAQEFINEAARVTGEYLATDPTRMSRRLRELAPALLKNDGIIVKCPDKNGGVKGRAFTFEQMPFTNEN